MSRPKPGTCRVCGCTDEMGCAEGCGWADEDRTLCDSVVCLLVETLAAALPYIEGGNKAVELRSVCKRLLRRARKEARW